ncbi:glycosyltransferase family 90 protein [Xylariaceae sp. FL1019]|nr:glycosyltransferase family 90 protein [Xylariaceae sp. FL1019]
MRSPAFPPRRPSHFIRYVFPTVLLVGLFYYLSRGAGPIPASHSANNEVVVESPVKLEESVENHPPTLNTPVKIDPDTHAGEEFEKPIWQQPDVEHDEAENGIKLGAKPDAGKSSDGKQKTTSGSSDNLKSGSGKIDDKTKETQSGKTATGSSGQSNSGTGTSDHESGQSTSGKASSGMSMVDDDTLLGGDEDAADATGNHPIDELIRGADKKFDEIMARESTTLKQAAAAYRERRGRHPPPGFDEWYMFAKDQESVVVEDFFDQIYHDLHPFWGLDPTVIRKESWDFEMTINIRNGNASAKSDWFWTQIWLKMIKTIEHLLPDMDLALNAMDEPRVVVPWEEMNTYVKKADASRKIIPSEEVVSTFQKLPANGKSPKKPATRKKQWEEDTPFWMIARRGCPPDSPARRMPVQKSFDQAPTITPSWALPHQYKGYVSNFSLSTEFCHQPDLQGLEGIFIHPLSTRSTRLFWPLFGGSKLATNNEILLPAPMYWNEEDRFTGGGDTGVPWESKISPLIWRGVATGGRNEEKNWRGFQRHRFVAMNNGTKIMLAEEDLEKPVNFQLPDDSYDITSRKENRMAEWVNSWADVGFTDLMCDPDNDPPAEEELHCPYTDPHFDVIPGVDLAEQFDYKFLPDIDGNSFSGRYLAFLRSTGVPIKSTLWQEWHDSRLVEWRHFVPMDNRFGDYYGIMEYFLGYKGPGGSAKAHDREAKRIAMQGKEWADRVLRKEDMQVYVLRLLLEYARISADDREVLGWVGDLGR